MKARIIYEYKDKKLKEILKESDITTAAELKGYLKRCLDVNCDAVKKDFNVSVEVDYGDCCPMLDKKFTLSDTKKLIDDLNSKLKIKELTKEIEDLENKLFKETQLNNTLIIDNQKMREENEKLKKDLELPIDGKFGSVDDLLNSYHSLEADFTKRCQKIKDLEKEVKDLKEAVEVKQTCIDSWKKYGDERNEIIKELQKQNNELMDKIELLEDTPVECSTCVAYTKLAIAKREIKDLEEKLETVVKNRTDWMLKYEKLYNENGTLKKELKELQEKYDQVLEFNDNLHEGNGELYKQNENLMKDIEDLKKKNEDLCVYFESEVDAIK